MTSTVIEGHKMSLMFILTLTYALNRDIFFALFYIKTKWLIKNLDFISNGLICFKVITDFTNYISL